MYATQVLCHGLLSKHASRICQAICAALASQVQAEAAGGKVVTLLGNHSHMLARGDYRCGYVSLSRGVLGAVLFTCGVGCIGRRGCANRRVSYTFARIFFPIAKSPFDLKSWRFQAPECASMLCHLTRLAST
eukprot:1141992-Pelagomonas_calceolata.AAC.2